MLVCFNLAECRRDWLHYNYLVPLTIEIIGICPVSYKERRHYLLREKNAMTIAACQKTHCLQQCLLPGWLCLFALTAFISRCWQLPKLQHKQWFYRFNLFHTYFNNTLDIWYCDPWILWHIAFCDHFADSHSQMTNSILLLYLILWLPYWLLWLFFIQIWGEMDIFLI